MINSRDWRKCTECGATWETSKELREVYGDDSQCPECESEEIEDTDPVLWEE